MISRSFRHRWFNISLSIDFGCTEKIFRVDYNMSKWARSDNEPSKSINDWHSNKTKTNLSSQGRWFCVSPNCFALFCIECKVIFHYIHSIDLRNITCLNVNRCVWKSNSSSSSNIDCMLSHSRSERAAAALVVVVKKTFDLLTHTFIFDGLLFIVLPFER